ncbi:MAG: cytochrome c [Roseibium sp.]|nr:cytochrome c [Roseibium sp.]
MTLRPKAFALVLAIGIAGVTTAVLAHQGATGVVKERMDGMGMLQEAVKQVGQMLRGNGAIDPETTRRAGQALQAHAGSQMTDLFPEGSLMPPSEALDVIWTDWAEFERLAAELDRAAQGLSSAAASNRAGVQAAFADVASTCKACHEKFREKKD